MKRTLALITVLALQMAGCASVLKYEKSDQLKTINEFDQAVKIEKGPETSAPPTPPETEAETKSESKSKTKTTKKHAASSHHTHAKKSIKKTAVKKSASKSSVTSKAAEPAAPAVRQPDIEDREGFAPGSRTPLKNPFHVGEVVTHSVSYFKVSAGEMKLKIEPFAQVNGRKAYAFVTELRSSSLFSSFYSVEDRVETLVDFEQLIPRIFSLHVKESGQLREARSLFDFDKNHATYWEKKVTKKDGEEEKKQDWDILPFSQNVFSAVFYMRVFKWEVGKEYSFRVADDEQNLVFKGKALRKEVLDTDLGPMKAIVIKPEVTLKGAFKPMGDIFIWLSDDDHKYVLRIESKIKIGTLVSEVTKIQSGM